MADPARDLDLPIRPDISHLITEDDEPLDNWFQGKQQRLLTDSLYASWAAAGQDRVFLAAANVGLFYSMHRPAVVPDAMISFDVTPPEDWWEPYNRCYMTWEFSKPPELVIEVVSNKKKTEESKFADYARAGVFYYAIYDPCLYLSKRPLRVYTLNLGQYIEVLDPARLEGMKLGLVLWPGNFEGMRGTWLRCCDHEGNLLLTGQERAEVAQEKAKLAQEKAKLAQQRAEQADQRAEQAEQEAERLRQKLRELGISSDAIAE